MSSAKDILLGGAGIDFRINALRQARKQAERTQASASQRELLAVIDRCIKEALIRKENVLSLIDQIENPLYAEALRIRFVDGQTLEQTAESIHYSYYHLCRAILPSAERALQTVIDNNHRPARGYADE